MNTQEKFELLIFPYEGKRDPCVCLEMAKNAELDDVIIVGWDKNGNLYLKGSPAQRKDVLMLLKTAETELMNQVFGAD